MSRPAPIWLNLVAWLTSHQAALTVRWLLCPPTEQPRLILCTGERMEGLVTRVYRALGLKTTDYEPVHARGLSNEFYCYANYEAEDVWKWREAKEES